MKVIPRFQKSPIDTAVYVQMTNYNKPREVNIPDRIISVVKHETGIDPTQYRHYRGAELVTARFMFMVMMVKFTNEPYRIIAAKVGRDHATINHAIKTVNNRCDTERDYKELYDRIYNQIKN